VLLCAAVYLPGMFSIPPVDRDEARFAQASRQMFESVALPDEAKNDAMHGGGLVVPMVQDRPRLNKPPLIYWAQAASAWLWTGGDPLRDAIWMYRLPSALFATLAVLITWRIGCSMLDPRAGWAGAALLAVCPMVVWDAHQARSDQLLLACTTLALWGLWEVWSRARRGRAGWVWPVALWIGVGWACSRRARSRRWSRR
jgi:4-amino-4-deoxy-L-arabinose transferase-like glycosyltransferase